MAATQSFLSPRKQFYSVRAENKSRRTVSIAALIEHLDFFFFFFFSVYTEREIVLIGLPGVLRHTVVEKKSDPFFSFSALCVQVNGGIEF